VERQSEFWVRRANAFGSVLGESRSAPADLPVGAFAMCICIATLVGVVTGCPEVRRLVDRPAANRSAVQAYPVTDCAADGGSAGRQAAPLSRRVDLRVLVLSASDLGTSMIKAGLHEAGVPFTEVELDQEDRPAITEAFLCECSSPSLHRARFQAVVAPNATPLQLADEERATLAHYQSEFGVRRVDAYVYPSPSVMLEAPSYSGALDGLVAHLTPVALEDSFAYLSGEVPFDDVDSAVAETYGYLARPLAVGTDSARSFTPLLEMQVPGTNSAGVLIGIMEDAGRQEMIISCAMNAAQRHEQVLFPGILRWLTHGVYLGTRRNYLTVHIDDVLLSDARWIPKYKCTRGNDCPVDVSEPDIRLNSEDVSYLFDWQVAHNFEFHLAFNGGGYDAAVEDTGAFPVGDALLARRGTHWVNHTYTHEYLGCIRDQRLPGFPCERDASGAVAWVSGEVASDEIGKNQEFARMHGLAFDPSELVTGEHSGLRRAPEEPSDNPALLDVLSQRGIAWIAADASREREQRSVAGTRTVPRYPMNLFFNTGRERELIDEFNWIHAATESGGSGLCSQNPATTCLAPLAFDTGFSEWIVPREARTLELHALSNDPRPHYAHQSNVAEDRLLYPVMERVLTEYRRMFAPNASLITLTLAEAGGELHDQLDWQANQPNVSAYVEGGRLAVSVAGSAALRVPLTLPAQSSGGENSPQLPEYGGAQTGWRTIRPTLGETMSLPASVGYAR
jgi:hypothetical protein